MVFDHPELGSLKLGKLEAKHDDRTLRLADYIQVKLPKPAAERDWHNGRTDWGMMRNDRLGDCTVAGVAHLSQLWNVNTGKAFEPSDDVVEAYYRLWAGYNPDDPTTDNGAYLLDIMNMWRKQSFYGHEIFAYAKIDATDFTAVKQALSLFGGLYGGLNLPKSCMTQRTWDRVAEDGGSLGGHCVVWSAYDPVGPGCITWGRIQKMTWQFFAKYCDELYAIISLDWLDHFGGDKVVNVKALHSSLRAISG